MSEILDRYNELFAEVMEYVNNLKEPTTPLNECSKCAYLYDLTKVEKERLCEFHVVTFNLDKHIKENAEIIFKYLDSNKKLDAPKEN